MDKRSEVQRFLTALRARLTPEMAGAIQFGGERRVPGLRREEVAQRRAHPGYETLALPSTPASAWGPACRSRGSPSADALDMLLRSWVAERSAVTR
jgi:hypothetical protein